MILSGRLMFEYLGWESASNVLLDAVQAQIPSGRVTYDIERHLDDGDRLRTDEFASEVVDRIAARSSA